ncbi:MAG: hypothetical protein FWH57_11935 [Oscillospiraceae bacterium]|nr:hypothetical protein [Oscillospiraceae bacterium]
MDYEQFYTAAQLCAKELKDKIDSQSRAVKKLQKCLADGDVGTLPKLFNTLREASQEREEALIRLEALAEGFDGQEYMANGDFAAQMLEYCRLLEVDVHGSYPTYEMFPCRVTINPETQDVSVDRKRMSCLRPSKLVSDIKKELDKLAKASFNAPAFAKELSAAYDIAIIKASRKKALAADASLYLSDLYEFLTPMRRHKKEYTKHNFAYDLARLYAVNDLTLDDGRKMRFDTVRDAKKAIRILDQNGSEQYITTVKFYKDL